MRALGLLALAACGREPAPVAVAPPIAHDARVAVAIDASAPCPVEHASLGPGLVVERWHVTSAALVAGEPCIDVVRADPKLYALRAHSADAKPAPDWLRALDAVAIGTDTRGHIIFIHARGAFTMHELSTELAAHDLAGAIFLEGGPEASLVVRGQTGALARVGSYETGFYENDGNTAFWDLPNVIALVPLAR